MAMCRIEPFLNDPVGTRLQALERSCIGPELKWGVEAPQVNVMRSRFDSSFAQPLSPSLESALRLTWVGRHDDMRGGKTEQAFLASALRWRPGEDLALNLRVGRELIGAFRERVSVSGLWQPKGRAALFTEWSATPLGTEWHQVGLRWWLSGRWLSLDARALYRPDGIGWGDEQLRLTIDLQP